jgi:Flp pilus assembly protein TadG
MHGIGDRISGLKRFGKRLWRARDGGVAMMFALAMPPMTMMAVCGLDIHRASSVRQSLQDALDSATLAAARSGETTDAGVRTVGMRVLRANLAQFPYVTLNEEVNSTNFDLNEDGLVTSYARVAVDTLVAGAFLGDELDVNVDSLVNRSTSVRLEVALVIDNTGSMAWGGKLNAAQDAAADLVESLAEAAENSTVDDPVRISLVPFSQTVRISSGFGTQNNRSSATAAGYLSRSTAHTGSTGTTGLFSTGVDRFELLDTLQIGWGGCVESRPYPYDVQDTAPSSTNQSTMFVPYFSPDTPDRNTFPNDNGWLNYWRYNDYLDEPTTSLSGLVSNLLGQIDNNTQRLAWDRLLKDSSKYQRNLLRSGIGVNLGPNQGCALEPLTRLTDDFDSITDSIDEMVATGNTNVPMGLMWGWHTLSPRAPFADGTAYGTEDVQKIVILLTDGDNVNSTANNPDNSTYAGVGLIWQVRLGTDIDVASSAQRRADRMDERLLELCENMRDESIVIYTVGVQVSTNSQNRLRSCAGSDDQFFNVTSAGGIADAFDQIVGRINNLRIVR